MASLSMGLSPREEGEGEQTGIDPLANGNTE